MVEFPDRIDDGFFALVARYLANDLDTAGELLLFERLAASHDCRAAMIDISLQARLISHAALQSSPQTIATAIVSHGSVGNAVGRFSAAVRRPVIWSIAGCAAGFVVYVALISWGMLDRGRNVVATSGTHVENQKSEIRNQQSEAAPVATIRDSVDAQWSRSTNKLEISNQKAEIAAGEPLAIDSGLVELQLKQGVTLVIEGPARWEIDGNNEATLKQGKLVAKVPQQAIGFTLETPTAKIVDLGTEFGVSVGEAGRTELHVLSGEVEASSLGAAAQPVTRLQQGQACYIATGRPIEMVGNIGNRTSFVRALRPVHDHGKLYCVSQGKHVVASSVYDLAVPSGEVFHIENVVDGRYDDSGGPQSWSFWLAESNQPAQFTIDLKEEFLVSEIRLQNTHNRQHNDRGTREYRVSFSLDGKTFVPVHRGELADVAGQKHIDWVKIPVAPPQQAHYVRFEAVSFYGRGAGLSELQVFGMRPSDASQEN